MSNYNQAGLALPAVQKPYKLLIVALGAVFAAATAMLTFNAHALTVGGACNFDDSVAGTWSLTADCTSTTQINVPADTTVEGNGHTIYAGFAYVNNSNNSVLGIENDNVTVQNLIIDGTSGPSLHGINVYEATGVALNNVTIKNASHDGVVVNGSHVTVSNVTTANSGWAGFDVDLGSGVTSPAVLTVAGPMNQANETADIYVDDTSKTVTVNDPLGQYTSTDNVKQSGDRLYTWSDVIAPDVAITNPADGSSVSGMVDIRGTVTDLNPDHYYLKVTDSSNHTVYSHVYYGGAQNFTDMSLYSWDTTGVADGDYTILLAARDAAGNRDAGSEASVTVTVNNVANSKEECMNNGWTAFADGFKNQGACVSYVNHNDGNGQDDTHARVRN